MTSAPSSIICAHDTLLTMLRKRIKDGRVLEMIEKWLHAGILDGKEMVYPDKGSPQGSVLSPLLANVYGRLFGRKGTVSSMTP